MAERDSSAAPGPRLRHDRVRRIARVALTIFFVWAGVNHFRNPQFYLRMMPPLLPRHQLLVDISGILEIVGGVGLLFPAVRAHAGWGLIALLLAIFPANIYMALHPELFPEISRLALMARLPLQLPLMAWAYWVSRPAPLTIDSAAPTD